MDRHMGGGKRRRERERERTRPLWEKKLLLCAGRSVKTEGTVAQ